MGLAEFKEKFLPLAGALYRVAFHILESEDDAEDAVQDLYLQLWKDRSSLGGVNNPRAYCITLMKNRCIDRIRRKTRHPSGDIPPDMISEEDLERRVIARERLEGLEKVLESLSAREREIFRMKILEDMTYEEISEKTGMNNLTMRVLLSNVRRKIRKTV